MSEDARDKVLQALMGQKAAKGRAPYLDELGLSDEEAVNRLLRILVWHLLLDRLMTELLSLNSIGSSWEQFEKVQNVMARLEMDTRIDLAKASQTISDSTARKIRTVNTIRNSLAHYTPKKGWNLTHIPELTSPKAFAQLALKAEEAIGELIPVMKSKLKKYA